jgi:hypothetical protein
MRVLTVTALAILAMVPSSGYAAITDGNGWRSLSPAMQNAYLNGYVEARVITRIPRVAGSAPCGVLPSEVRASCCVEEHGFESPTRYARR